LLISSAYGKFRLLILIITKSAKRILLFVIFWFVINLIQSFFTEIIDDEAYHWIYSKFLDWGYFDHPPMIAILIRLGSVLLPGAIGVRLITSLMGAGSIFLVFLMLKDEVRDLRILMLVCFSIPLLHFHVAGFIATPDLPLVFTSTLFFFFYRRYLEKETPLIILLLSLSIALMLYSKYHAFLIILFTILSNLRILYHRSFWLIVISSTILYLPHIFWQFNHDFVSFSYHLIDRNNPFQVKYLLEYLVNQFLLLGPFCGVVLFYLGVTRKTSDHFNRALRFNVIGFLLFFLVSSLRGHVEPHWTAAAFIPLILLTVPLIEKNLILKKWIYILGFISIPIVIFARISLMVELEPFPEKLSQRFHHKEEFYQQIHKEAKGRPVVFSNSYQKASLYWFFTGEQAFSQNNKHYRKNQFDLLHLESDLQGEEVLYFPAVAFPGCDTLETIFGDFTIHHTDYFCHFNRIKVILPEMDWEFGPGEKVHVNLKLENPTQSPVCFCDSCTHKPQLIYSFFSENGDHRACFASYTGLLPDLVPGDCTVFPVEMTAPETPGKYQLMFSFGARDIPAGINGRPIKMTVRSRSSKNSG